MIYQISYDLNRPGQDYADVINAIKSFDGWCHVQKSVWFVCSNGSASDVANFIRMFLDVNDSLFVSEVTRNRNGWLPQRVWNWLERHDYLIRA